MSLRAADDADDDDLYGFGQHDASFRAPTFLTRPFPSTLRIEQAKLLPLFEAIDQANHGPVLQAALNYMRVVSPDLSPSGGTFHAYWLCFQQDVLDHRPSHLARDLVSLLARVDECDEDSDVQEAGRQLLTDLVLDSVGNFHDAFLSFVGRMRRGDTPSLRSLPLARPCESPRR